MSVCSALDAKWPLVRKLLAIPAKDDPQRQVKVWSTGRSPTRDRRTRPVLHISLIVPNNELGHSGGVKSEKIEAKQASPTRISAANTDVQGEAKRSRYHCYDATHLPAHHSECMIVPCGLLLARIANQAAGSLLRHEDSRARCLTSTRCMAKRAIECKYFMLCVHAGLLLSRINRNSRVYRLHPLEQSSKDCKAAACCPAS